MYDARGRRTTPGHMGCMDLLTMLTYSKVNSVANFAPKAYWEPQERDYECS